MSVLSAKYFHDEAAAIAKLEEILWSGEPECPHCGGVGKSYEIKGKRTRPGLRKCGHCRKQYTVKVGTVFESSHVPLHKWFQAAYLLCASKKGISAHQLHRTLEVTYKTAWFMMHRLREAMRDGELSAFGSDGGIVEVDETFIGNDREKKPKHEKKGRGVIHTNTIEGYFSIFKRGMKGVYQHCAKKHLHRYLAEFDFRYNERNEDDMGRAVNALRSIRGKRLTYQQSSP